MKEKHARQLLDSMELIDDEIIEAAARPPRRRVRAWKVVLPIAACLAMVGTMMVVMMVGVGSEKKPSYMSFADRDEWYVRPNGGVKRELVAQIQEGMCLNDVIALIGKPNRPIHREPFIAFQWDLDNGECLHIFLRKVPSYFEQELPEVQDGKIDWNVPFDTLLMVDWIEIEPEHSQICQCHPLRDEYVEWLEKYWENTDEE